MNKIETKFKETKLKNFSLKEHFIELRSRLSIIFCCFCILFLICYYYSADIYKYLLKPLSNASSINSRSIIYTGLPEAFFAYLKLSAFGATILVFPIILIQIYLFLAPGLYKQEKKIVIVMLTLSPLLFLIGGALAFYILMPKALLFFLSFEDRSTITPIILQAKISEYLSLVIHLILAFGISFQLPIIIVILKMMNIINIGSLKAKRRLAIVINFIIAGILTPPDVLSQIGLAIPLLLLYELSIILCKLFENLNTINTRIEISKIERTRIED